MDDLEKAILISFESGAVDSALKSQAVSYCQRIKETPSICSICIEKLWFSKLVQVQFWCLQTLQDVLQMKYGSMISDEQSYVRKSVFSMACLEAVDNEQSYVRKSSTSDKHSEREIDTIKPKSPTSFLL